MRRLLPPLTAVLVLLGLVLPAQAASPKAGRWKGATYDAATGKRLGKLSFKVRKSGKRKTMRRFRFVLYADCPPPNTYRIRKLTVPSMRVRRRGAVSKTYRIKSRDGTVRAAIYVKGRFRSRKRFSGTVEYTEPVDDPLCEGEARIKARTR